MTAPGYSPEFADFLEELGAEETVEREFKEGVGGLPRSIWETISAFANTSGGIIVLGVRQQDDGLELVGVPKPHRLLEDLHSQCRNHKKINQDVLPPGSVSIREVDKGSVVVVHVRPANRRLRPVFINGQAYGGTYVRRHTGDHKATTDEVNRMMREASDLPADMVILPWVRLEGLDQDSIILYRRQLLIRDANSHLAQFDTLEFLRAIEGYRRDSSSGDEGITVAGLLMFGGEAAIREWRTRHLIDARLLPLGADIGEPDWADRILCEGNVFGAFYKIYAWLTRDLPTPFRLEHGVRVEDSEQHRALREALVNLLVHADYSERDASLILRWDGGIRFRNPGRSRIPSPGFHSENRSDPRNPALVRMFRRIGLAEEAGTGVPRIFRSWRELGYEPPEIDPGDERHEFAIALHYEHLLSDEDRQWLEGFNEAFSDSEQLALVIARQDDGVDNQALREVTGLHGADASKVLTGLRDHGHLEMVGSKRGAWYRLSPMRELAPRSDIASTQLQLKAPWVADSTAGKGASTADNAQSIAGKDASTADNARGTADNPKPDEQSEPGSPTTNENLLHIAAAVSGRRRIPPELLAETVVDLCSLQPLSLRELMTLLHRSKQHLRATIGALEDAGRIQPLYAQRQHPMQKYVAAPDRSVRSKRQSRR